MGVSVDLDPAGKRLEVWFRPNPEMTEKVKSVVGRRFVPAAKSHNGAPHWVVPLDFETAKELRQLFGPEMRLSDRVAEWGRSERRRSRELRTLASSETAVLTRLPVVLPKLYADLHIGPIGRGMSPEDRAKAMEQPASFQCADVAFGVRTSGIGNFLEMGLGKTPITIGTIFEAELDAGPHLVIAPVSAMDTTWLDELEARQPHAVFIANGTKAQKEAVYDAFRVHAFAAGEPAWLVVNPDQVRLREEFTPCEDNPKHKRLSPKKKADRKIIDECFYCRVKLIPAHPLLFETKWNTIIIDECHQFGVMNPKSFTGKGVKKLRTIDGGKRFVLSGTPMGGKEINLFPILQWLDPVRHRSKWRWVDHHLEVTSNGFGKRIGGLRRCSEHFGEKERNPRGACRRCDEMEDAFYDSMAPYIIRRTKEETLPWLPPKLILPLWCGWGSLAHRDQYNKFADDASVVVNGREMSAENTLTEYLRLGQFAFGRYERDGVKLVPTEDSGKLVALEGKLATLGIFSGDGDQSALIFSHSRDIVDLVATWARAKGAAVGTITGGMRREDRRERVKAFQAGRLRLLVIVTSAGGTSLTLDRADHVFILDETWNPDDQSQAEDRAHRASRIHDVTVWYLRTRGTIDEFKMDLNVQKAITNRRTMDLRRMRLREDASRT